MKDNRRLDLLFALYFEDLDKSVPLGRLVGQLVSKDEIFEQINAEDRIEWRKCQRTLLCTS